MHERLLWRLFVIYALTLLAWRLAFVTHNHATEGLQASASLPKSSLVQPHSRKKSYLNLSDSAENVLHFIQISDIHVSKFRTKGGLTHLKSFIANELPLIAPELVLATGDLTDAKFKYSVKSKQHIEEWQAYHDALSSSKVLDRQKGRFWWDIRGNHDCFNVPAFNHSENYFRILSASKNSDGFAFELKKTFGTYSFIALDACPQNIGPSKPLNFFGILDSKDMNFFASALNHSITHSHNHTFAMTHYPTATILLGRTKEGVDFWDMSHHVSLWLSGHLHKLAGGLGETMYAYQRDSLMELELGDMKTHGLFRIIVVDNDLISFRDVPLHSDTGLPILERSEGSGLPLLDRLKGEKNISIPPIVLVTNPKDARFIIPNREPVELIQSSSHIRTMVWSSNPVSKMYATIDSHLLPSEWVYNGKGKAWSSIKTLYETNPHIPLWTLKWDAKKYLDSKTHELIVHVIDSEGLKGNHTVLFRADGKAVDMDAGFGGFLISINFKELFIVFYVLMTVFFLLIPKTFVMITRALGTYQEWMEETSRELLLRDKASCLYYEQRTATIREWTIQLYSDSIFTTKAYFFRHCELSNDATLFYPCYLFLLYITCFPWFLADFVPSSNDPGRRWGSLYIYGIQMQDGSWEPMLDTWLFGLSLLTVAFYALVYQILPFLMYISFCVTSPVVLYSKSNPRLTGPIHQRWYVRLIVLSCCLYHLLDCFSLVLFYGWYSALISPAKSWFIVWQIYTLWRLRNGPSEPLFDKDKNK